MNLDRMLRMCREGQWQLSDLDWSHKARTLSREDEIAVVQFFLDMAGIERLAAALFQVQKEQSPNPILREIFTTFVDDELRHARVALRLAAFYNRNSYRSYAQNPFLIRFERAFVRAVRHLSPDIANAYITTGELLLDVALLRSLDDFVDDEMSNEAMARINRDESRHIAVDLYMVDYYASDDYQRWLRDQPPTSLRDRLRAGVTLATMFRHAAPFFRDVFFGPMDRLDPSGKRLRQAFKRIQLIGSRPGVVDLPFSRFIKVLRDLFNDPVVGTTVAPVVQRITGLDPRVIRVLHTQEEETRFHRMSMDEVTRDTLGLKSVAS